MSYSFVIFYFDSTKAYVGEKESVKAKAGGTPSENNSSRCRYSFVNDFDFKGITLLLCI
ncbi:hypothetical protein [Xylanibacter oryzae]|uniref:hypothetical protein n=1 Tax=Xylanibacter oryzae TaxID=185293 RepID=UPI0004AEF26E|nr:hypothetical protein [Xylanibacter oryzae]